MTRPAMNPLPVDWAGENPGMYLKARADGPFVTLVSFFRVVLSPHGKGHAAFLVLDPSGKGSDPARPNVCITDNEPLAEYLRDGFVKHFLAFKGSAALATTKLVPGWDFVAGGDGRSVHTEWFRSTLGQVQLTWGGWGDRYEVELAGDRKAVTGKHEMFSTFVDSHEASGYVNGRALEGRAFPREFAGKKDSSTAFLAFSETWLKA